MRALSSTGWTSGAATYDSGFETHNLDRPAPRCSALLSGLVEVIPHLVPSPVAFSTSQPPRRFRVHSKLPKPRDLQHNHARYDLYSNVKDAYEYRVIEPSYPDVSEEEQEAALDTFSTNQPERYTRIGKNHQQGARAIPFDFIAEIIPEEDRPDAG